MTDARRLAYLQALDIPVWVRRDHASPVTAAASRAAAPDAAVPRLDVTPGESGLLLICRTQQEAASPLACDIARSVRRNPGWAWPAPAETATSLAEAVSEHLFTGLVIFGADLARSLLGADRPDRIGQARLWVVDGLERLADSGPARRAFWRFLCDQRLAATL